MATADPTEADGHQDGAPVHDHVPGATGARTSSAVHLRAPLPEPGAPAAPVPVQPGQAPVHPASAPRTGQPTGRGNLLTRIGARAVHGLSALAVHRAEAPRAPVRHPERTSASGSQLDGAPGRPVALVRTVAPKKRHVRTTPATGSATLGEQWGRLTEARGPWAVVGLRLLVILIAIGLVGVVIAPPALSAHDIIKWAQSDSEKSGLGLSLQWAWVTFIALDFAAGVCVLICVYCAIVNTKPGVFALYVWAFAGATAYANLSFGQRPGAPGDAEWFFPGMSLVGPLLLHSVLGFLRKRVKGAQGNKRGQRPSFPIADWFPLTGTPQDTYGAWRVGAMLGIEVPDSALWAYRAVSLDAGWCRRWRVKALVRAQQVDVFRTRLTDENLALAIPGLVPDGAFVSLTRTEEVHDQDAPVHARATGPAALPRGKSGAPAPDQAHQTGAPALVQGGAPVAPDAPGAPDQGSATVVNLDAASRASAHAALERIFEAYGTSFNGWDGLARTISLSRIERDLKIGKRRTIKALMHAEDVLPWADAVACRETVGVTPGDAHTRQIRPERVTESS